LHRRVFLAAAASQWARLRELTVPAIKATSTWRRDPALTSDWARASKRTGSMKRLLVKNERNVGVPFHYKGES
jgi:hypothetical protein